MISYIHLELQTQYILKVTVFWDETPCSLGER